MVLASHLGRPIKWEDAARFFLLCSAVGADQTALTVSKRCPTAAHGPCKRAQDDVVRCRCGHSSSDHAASGECQACLYDQSVKAECKMWRRTASVCVCRCEQCRASAELAITNNASVHALIDYRVSFGEDWDFAMRTVLSAEETCDAY